MYVCLHAPRLSPLTLALTHVCMPQRAEAEPLPQDHLTGARPVLADVGALLGSPLPGDLELRLVPSQRENGWEYTRTAQRYGQVYETWKPCSHTAGTPGMRRRCETSYVFSVAQAGLDVAPLEGLQPRSAPSRAWVWFCVASAIVVVAACVQCMLRNSTKYKEKVV